MKRRMPSRVEGLLIVLFIGTVLAAGIASPLGAATVVSYDTLAKGPIDSMKWDNYEFERVIDGGKLKLDVRSAAGSTGPITNSLPMKNPASVNKIQATITPVNFAATSDITSTPNAKIMAMVGGRFYNDGTTDGKTGSCLGDILAQVGVGTTDVTPTALSIYWAVVRYTTDDCNTTTKLGSGVFVSSAATGAASTVSVDWNGANRFTFTYNDGTVIHTKSFTDTSSSSINTPNYPFKGLFAKIKDNAGLNGRITADFGNVYVNGALYDDFAGEEIDQAKWTGSESERFIDNAGKHLVLSARGSANSVTMTDNNLAVAMPETVKTIQATVNARELTIDPNSSSHAFAYVGGRFFNDGSPGTGAYVGDIGAFIKIQVTNAGGSTQYVGKWKVVRFTGDTIGDNVTIAEGPDTPKTISLKKPYTLSVGWDGTKFTFVGNRQTYTYIPNLTVTAAKMPFKGVGAVISDAEVTGTATVYFTNVMVDAPQSLTVDISGTGSVKSSPVGLTCDNTSTPCSGSFQYGKKVTLNAKAGTGWVFERWVNVSGTACSTKTSCQVTADDTKEVQANFIKQPTISVSPAGKKSFPKVKAGGTKPATVIFTVTNKTTKGVADLTVSNIALNTITGDAGDFQLQGTGACTSAPIASKGKCTFKVIFLPAHTGDKTATVTIDSNDPSAPSTVINLSGTGT